MISFSITFEAPNTKRDLYFCKLQKTSGRQQRLYVGLFNDNVRRVAELDQYLHRHLVNVTNCYFCLPRFCQLAWNKKKYFFPFFVRLCNFCLWPTAEGPGNYLSCSSSCCGHFINLLCYMKSKRISQQCLLKLSCLFRSKGHVYVISTLYSQLPWSGGLNMGYSICMKTL